MWLEACFVVVVKNDRCDLGYVVGLMFYVGCGFLFGLIFFWWIELVLLLIEGCFDGIVGSVGCGVEVEVFLGELVGYVIGFGIVVGVLYVVVLDVFVGVDFECDDYMIVDLKIVGFVWIVVC